VHRLLKNQVPQKDDHYTLFTRPALQYMDVDPARLGLQPHIESYDHFGSVECFFGTSTCGVEPRASRREELSLLRGPSHRQAHAVRSSRADPVDRELAEWRQ